jgi:archaellum biogenesis ATPase FlaH
LKPVWEKNGQVKFVDCYSKMLGIQCSDTPSIRRVSSLLDFTKLTVTIAELCSNFILKNRPAVMVMDSLSALLIYSSLQTVMRFLHIFTGKLRKQNVLSFFLIEEGTHEESTFNLLKTFSNGIIKMGSNPNMIQFEGFIGTSKTSIFYEITKKDVILKNKV